MCTTMSPKATVPFQGAALTKTSLFLRKMIPKKRCPDVVVELDPPLGSVHTPSEKFESVSSFLRLGLPSTLLRHKKGAFGKRSSKRRNLKTPTLRFSVDTKHF